MTAATLARVGAQARQVDAGRVLLTLLMVVPYALGWVSGGVVRSAVWLSAAVAVGWRDGRGRAESRDAPA